MSNCHRPNQKTSTNQDDERGAHCFGVECTGYTSARNRRKANTLKCRCYSSQSYRQPVGTLLHALICHLSDRENTAPNLGQDWHGKIRFIITLNALVALSARAPKAHRPALRWRQSAPARYCGRSKVQHAIRNLRQMLPCVS